MHKMAIWETGEWPEKWTFSTFIPLQKNVILNSAQITEQLLLPPMQTSDGIACRILIHSEQLEQVDTFRTLGP